MCNSSAQHSTHKCAQKSRLFTLSFLLYKLRDIVYLLQLEMIIHGREKQLDINFYKYVYLLRFFYINLLEIERYKKKICYKQHWEMTYACILTVNSLIIFHFTGVKFIVCRCYSGSSHDCSSPIIIMFVVTGQNVVITTNRVASALTCMAKM